MIKPVSFSAVRPVRFGERSEQEYRKLLERMEVRNDGRTTHYSLLTGQPLTRKDAYELQRLMGYPPQGYDLVNFQTYRTQDGQHRTSWYRYNSCD